jgi:hypothetical protein
MSISMRVSAAHGSTARRWIGCVMGRSAGNSMPSWSCHRTGWRAIMPINGS